MQKFWVLCGACVFAVLGPAILWSGNILEQRNAEIEKEVGRVWDKYLKSGIESAGDRDIKIREAVNKVDIKYNKKMPYRSESLGKNTEILIEAVGDNKVNQEIAGLEDKWLKSSSKDKYDIERKMLKIISETESPISIRNEGIRNNLISTLQEQQGNVSGGGGNDRFTQQKLNVIGKNIERIKGNTISTANPPPILFVPQSLPAITPKAASQNPNTAINKPRVEKKSGNSVSVVNRQGTVKSTTVKKGSASKRSSSKQGGKISSKVSSKVSSKNNRKASLKNSAGRTSWNRPKDVGKPKGYFTDGEDVHPIR